MLRYMLRPPVANIQLRSDASFLFFGSYDR
jgi:hypothetical protein